MSKRFGIEFKALWNVVSSSPAPELGIQPARVESDKIPGVFIDCKKNWVQLEAKNGLCVYVARQKLTRQVDLSGFGKDLVGTEPLRAKNGRVQAHLDLSDPNALAHLHMLLVMMVSLPSPEAKRREVPVTEAGKARKEREKSAKPDGASSPISKLDRIAATERLMRIWEIAKRRGVLPTEQTLHTLISNGAEIPEDLKLALEADTAKNGPADVRSTEEKPLGEIVAE